MAESCASKVVQLVSSINGPSLWRWSQCMWLPKGVSDLLCTLWRGSSSLHSPNSAIQPQCYKAGNLWPLDYDSCTWFCTWAEFWEVWISDQLHMKTVDDMQTCDKEIKILFDLIYNSSLFFTVFHFVWKEPRF